MKILITEIFISYTQGSVVAALEKMGHDVTQRRYYTPEDPYGDRRIDEMILKDISDGYDCVFSVNFWPPAARVCHEKGVPYIAWCYDCPPNLSTTQDMEYDTNYIFMFDRATCEEYEKQGITRFYHLPLATDCDMWDRVRVPADAPRYEVSMLGSLYESTFPEIFARLDEYEQGYWNGVVKAQLQIYGYYLADEMITPERLEAANQMLVKAGVGGITFKKLSYSLGTYITYQDRVMLLAILSNRFQTALVTKHIGERLKNVMPKLITLDAVDYEAGMPAFFKCSKVNLNPSLRLIKTGIPLRALDIMGAGGFLLSNYQEELAEHFVNGEDMVMYESVEDAVDKVRFYVNNDTERERVARNGYEKVKTAFTYEDRLHHMFETAGLTGGR